MSHRDQFIFIYDIAANTLTRRPHHLPIQMYQIQPIFDDGLFFASEKNSSRYGFQSIADCFLYRSLSSDAVPIKIAGPHASEYAYFIVTSISPTKVAFFDKIPFTIDNKENPLPRCSVFDGISQTWTEYNDASLVCSFSEDISTGPTFLLK